MLDFVSILFTDWFMGYAAAPCVAFIVYGIQTFFSAYNNETIFMEEAPVTLGGFQGVPP